MKIVKICFVAILIRKGWKKVIKLSAHWPDFAMKRRLDSTQVATVPA